MPLTRFSVKEKAAFQSPDRTCSQLGASDRNLLSQYGLQTSLPEVLARSAHSDHTQKKIVPENVTAGLETVAIRSPSHPLFRKVLESTGMPIAAPSANPYSTISPTSAIEVMNSLGNSCPPVLDGGKCNIGLESTVLDLTCETPKILRPGPISKDELEKALGRQIVNPSETKGPGNPQ